MTEHNTLHLEQCLERLHQGDTAGRMALLEGFSDRLMRLAHVMFRDYPRLRRWTETGDVAQNAVIRLDRALQAVRPPTLRDFYRLATLEIRRELLDMVRHHFGPQGEAGHHLSGSVKGEYDRGNLTLDPERLAVWSEFHRQVEALPDAEREVFELIWYQDLGHTDAARVLGVHPRTVKRHWLAALQKLHEVLGGELPGMT
jgi:RNA polymerase sigma-70 factor (ECF subfamily)